MKTINSGVPIPVEFSGPAQLILFTRYGDPREPGFESKWIMHWEVKKHFPWFPANEMYIHKHFQSILQEGFDHLTSARLYEEIISAEKCFEIRPIRGGSEVLSVHSWGAALDMNADENPLGSAGSWSKAFIETMTKHHIFCGQNWTGRKEPMHFAMVNG